MSSLYLTLSKFVLITDFHEVTVTTPLLLRHNCHVQPEHRPRLWRRRHLAGRLSCARLFRGIAHFFFPRARVHGSRAEAARESHARKAYVEPAPRGSLDTSPQHLPQASPS